MFNKMLNARISGNFGLFERSEFTKLNEKILGSDRKT